MSLMQVGVRLNGPLLRYELYSMAQARNETRRENKTNLSPAPTLRWDYGRSDGAFTCDSCSASCMYARVRF